MTAPATKGNAWLRLLRPPNLFTVPGDPLAGFILASGVGGMWDARMAWVALSALAMYASGLILNDVADCETDRRERPDRPLACGAVARRDALIAGLLLGALGVAFSFPAGKPALVVGVCLFLLVLVYNFVTPRGSPAGLLVMGLCRSASVALGIAAAGNWSSNHGIPWVAAAGTGLYIVAVSRMAAGETRAQRLGWSRWVPAAIMAVTFGILAWTPEVVPWVGVALGGLSLFVTWNLGRRLGPEPKPEAVPPAIGGYIRALIMMQATYCAMGSSRGVVAATILLCLWPLSAIVSKRFYAS